MKALVRFALQALLLLIVALASAVTAMRLAIHGREVAVPDLTGKPPVEARRIAEAEGFQFAVERQYYSATVPEGRVLSQLPPAGTLIRRGWQIRVAESLGPQRVEIPDVLGQSERAAEINIRRRGLDITAIAQVPMPDVPAGQVIAQSPSPNASSISAPKISLLTAEAAPPQAFVMPSLLGQTLGSVTAVLKDSGLRVGNVTEAQSANASVPAPPEPSPNSVVVSQNPSAGQKIVVGDVVNLEVR